MTSNGHLQLGMAICNDKMKQLYLDNTKVASDEEEWKFDTLTNEYTVMETQYEGLYRSFKEYCR